MHIHIKLNEVICCWNQIKWSHTFLRKKEEELYKTTSVSYIYLQVLFLLSVHIVWALVISFLMFISF
ncbi:hypothetical protein HanXRQr2_Chr11g0507961 [Helianthus annuus]|uniref:Uncharacterized protein n=1 Tax=Helianthus annuus TaxID=4232 RepID=A0A251TDI9_HELAN|nr:hypothetical protein HanXRQr2_Chr11g0507961 [Helianthus annuus]